MLPLAAGPRVDDGDADIVDQPERGLTAYLLRDY
jgi:hypothetical protein